ncbi:MAG: hypothetical protein WDM90_18285 [Ferruginibacter sp.]
MPVFSYTMMWQTYPLIKVALIIIVLLFIARFIFGRLLNNYLQKDTNYKRRGIGMYIISFFVLAQIIVGKIVVKPGQVSIALERCFYING